LAALWNEFSAGGAFSNRSGSGDTPEYGALAAKTNLRPGESRIITFALAWYLPHRRYKHREPGNYYTSLSRNAKDVAHRATRRLDSTWEALSTWQQTMFNNSLPDWLQGALANSVATMYKTGMRFGDGAWRQWESFSCAGLNPGHVDFYRVLPFAFFFPALNQNLLRSHAESQESGGFIPEQLTTGCSAPESELGRPGGRAMGDSETIFILCAWQVYSWTGDRQSFDLIWPNVKEAAA
jgi:uncharacterized protein (DUF608 family)